MSEVVGWPEISVIAKTVFKSGTPGLSWRKRDSGKNIAYWICPNGAAKNGFRPRTQRVWAGLNEPTEQEMNFISGRCRALHSEAAAWQANIKGRKIKRVGYVYFAKCGEFVKVGFATSLEGRLTALRTGSPHEITIIAAVRGSMLDEKLLHWKLGHLHVRGEWFRMHEDIRRFIAELVPLEQTAHTFANEISVMQNVAKMPPDKSTT